MKRKEPKFYTARGRLTRYALACGYVEKAGTDEAGAVMEQFAATNVLRVMQRGRWGRKELYCGPCLWSARKALDAGQYV